MKRRVRRRAQRVRSASPSRARASFVDLLILPRRFVLAAGLVLGVLLPAVDGAHANPATTGFVGVASTVTDSLRGRSGKLLARFVGVASPPRDVALFTELFGSDAIQQPGVYSVSTPGIAHSFAFVALRSFAEKTRGRLGRYRLGFWPGERGLVHAPAYRNPSGFIEVTPANQDLYVSEHFRLRDFLTHDQQTVWPKYLVLHERLVDKLELVIAELERSGIAVQHMTVMSGFRTPQYNATGGDTTGRDELSRHMYGDASDVFVDNDGDGKMDDLNGDGRIDYRDARVILAAVGRVEQTYRELVGGGGVYKGTAIHGPFAHIDARGTRLRWEEIQ